MGKAAADERATVVDNNKKLTGLIAELAKNGNFEQSKCDSRYSFAIIQYFLYIYIH